jgi:SlyX protein
MTSDEAKRIETLEQTVAHLARQAEDLSDVVARQDSEIATLTRRVEMLMRREAERMQDESGGIHLGTEKPPHW